MSSPVEPATRCPALAPVLADEGLVRCSPPAGAGWHGRGEDELDEVHLELSFWASQAGEAPRGTDLEAEHAFCKGEAS